jgi:hypothetical protein
LTRFSDYSRLAQIAPEADYMASLPGKSVKEIMEDVLENFMTRSNSLVAGNPFNIIGHEKASVRLFRSFVRTVTELMWVAVQ